MSQPGSAHKRMEAPAIAAAAVRSWELLQSRLAPVIGEDGFRVLYARSLHRARAQHAWLARDSVPLDTPYSMLKSSLESQTPERATAASRALMAHFNELLNALIGKQLATRLIGRI